MTTNNNKPEINISNYTPIIYETAVDFGDAVSFDGVDDYVEVSTNQNPTNAITVEAWAKSNTATWNSYGSLVSKRNAFILNPQPNSNEIKFNIHNGSRWYNASYTPDSSFDITQWHHYAGTYDGVTLRFYVDGKEVSTSEVNGGAINLDNGVLTIGRDDGFNRYFNGQIDEVRIWETTRTQEEIQEKLYQKLEGSEDGLVGYYNFDKDSVDGNTVSDITENGNNGTFNGTLNNGDDANFVDSEIPTFKGYVDIELNNKVTNQPGILLNYQIDSDSTATQDEDFYNSQTDISTTDSEPQTDSIFIAEGEDSARIYLTALPDAVVEGDENIKLTLLPDFNKALDLDGSNDYVNLNNSVVGLTQNDFTLEAWIKTTGTEEAIIVKNDGDTSWERGEKAFYINDSGQVDFVGWGNNYIRGTTRVNDGQWHHVAVVWDYSSGTSGTGKIYVDGVDDTSSSGYRANNGYKVGDTLKIGRPNYGEAPNHFSGEIDEVRIWNKARTEEEIQDTIYATLNGNESNLVAYYNFNDDLVEGNVISNNLSIDKSLSFDGSNDYVKVPNSDEFELTDGTIEFWVKPDWVANSKNYNPAVLANRNTNGTRYSIHIRKNLDGVDLFNGSQVGTVSYNFEQGNWYHVALVETGTSTKVFINGELQGSMGVGFSGVTGKDFHVGSSDGTKEFFEGEIDEVRIWNKARSQAEIQSTLDSSLNGNESNLVAYYTFDDGTATDLTSNNNNGTINGASAVNLDGQLISNNKVLSLDGNGDYVRFNNNLAIGNSYTVEGWFNSNNSIDQTLVALTDGASNNHYALIELRANGNLRFLHRSPANANASAGTNIYSSTAYNDGEWHHLAAVKNTLGLTLYVDGIEVGTAANSSSINDGVNLTIGQLSSVNSSRAVNGQIDEIRIWNTARTSNEIQNYRNQRLDGTENGLVAYYSFDDGTANDNSSNGNNGSFIGNATTTTNNDLSIGVPVSAADNFFTDSLASDTFATNGATYSIETTQSAEITIKDTDAYSTGVLIVDEYGDVINNSNPAVVDTNGEAKFKIKLSSQPTANVTINLNANQGSLNQSSFTFNDSNWDTYQEITLSGLSSSFNDFNITATFSSTDRDYSGSKNVIISDSSDNVKVKVTEGGPELELTPTVSITATSDATEGNESKSGVFTVSLDTPAPEGGLVIPVSVSSTATEGTDYNLYADSVTYSKENALSFDGVDDYVDTNAGILNLATADFTLEVWIKTDKVNQDIIVKNDDDTTYEAGEKRLFVLENGTVAFAGFANARISGGTAINDGEWHHIAVVWDYSSGSSGTGKLYLDGEDDTNPSAYPEYAANNLDRSTDTIKLGGSVTSNLFEGELDEVRFWNKTRTQEEIQDNLHTKLEGTEDGLVAYYNFDDTSDTAYIGQSLSFDGVNDYVQLTDGGVGGTFDGGSTAFTITGWIKPNSLSTKSTNHQIENVFLARATTGSNDNFELGITTDGKLNLYLDTNGGDTTIELGNGELTTGEWHSFALIFDSGSVTAYIDGTEYTGSVNGTQLDQAIGSPFTLGASINFDTFYNGEIDEVSIWQKVLTQSEIQENLSTKLAGTEDGLVAYYNFDNDSGTSITDGRGSNNGTLINGNGNNLVGSNIGYTLTDWEVTETPVVKIAEGETEATITVSKIDDEIAESTPETVTVTLKDSDNYDLDTNNQTATVTLNDDDEAGIEFARLTTSDGTVVATSLEYYNNTVVTSEVVEGSTFGVRLSSQPTDNVTLTLTIGDNTEGEFANAASTQTLTFTSDDWDTYQEVTLYGVDDNEEDGNIEYSINVTASSSSDSNYNGITDSILVSNQDNENGVEEVDENQLNNDSITAYLKALNSETSEDGTTTAEVEISLSEAAPAGGMIVEYEILAGTADIGEISSNPLSILSFDQGLYPSFADVDGDGDFDAFATLEAYINVTNSSNGSNTFTFTQQHSTTYYENIGTANFSEYQVSTTNPLNISDSSLTHSAPTFADIDNDGNLDAFTGRVWGDIYHYEYNSTTEQFELIGTAKKSDGSDIDVGSYSSPVLVDIDGDNDFDLFTRFSNASVSEILYYENIGDAENPSFEQRTGVDNPLNQVDLYDGSTDFGANSRSFNKHIRITSGVPTFGDVDGDGDYDALVSTGDGKLYYYVNVGDAQNPVFELETDDTLILNNISVDLTAQPTLVDIDNDGLAELFVANESGKVDFYEINNTGKVYIAEGETSANISFNAVSDLIAEDDETIEIKLIQNIDATVEVTSAYDSNTNTIGLQLASDSNSETNEFTLLSGDILNFTGGSQLTVVEDTIISTDTTVNVSVLVESYSNGNPLTPTVNETSIQSDYQTGDNSSATLTITDDDTAKILITGSEINIFDRAFENYTEISSFTTSEDGSTETFYVSLDTKPTDNVAVYLGVENSEEGLLSDDNESDENLVKLVFSPDNWNTSQAVTLTSVNDDIDDGNTNYNIISTVISEDIKYNEDNVILKLTEDFNYVDGSSNTISLLVDDLSVQETELAAGTQLTFANGMILEVGSDTTLSNSMATNVNVTQVQAANQILKNTTAFIDEDNSNSTEYVQIIVTEEYADGRLELQVDESSSIASVDLSLGQQLTFSNGTVFTVEVAETLSNTEASTIFGRIDSNLLKVATTEVSTNATAEVTTDYTDGNSGKTEIIVNTDYNEAAGTLSLRINDTTASEVELLAGTQIDFSNGAAVTLDEDVTLTTTASSVNVSGVGNEITTSFTEDISSDISVTNNDNDTAAVVVDRYDISSLEGYGNNFFNVKLATQPLGEVTITMNSVDANGDKDYNISLADEFDGESYSVTFDETNWNLAKAVKVQAVDDYDIEYNHSSYINFTVSSDEDSIYDAVTPPNDVIVKIEDNDLPTASIQAVAAASEAGSPGYFIVSLDKAAPDSFDGTGIVVNYSVSGTVDTDGSGETDDLKTLTGSVRIAPGETRSPIIAFPIDDFKVEAIPLEVVSAAGNNVRLQINTAKLSDSQKQSLIEVGTVTLDDDTELTFSNGAIAKVNGNYNLQINANGSVTSVNTAVEFTSDITTVGTNETTSIPQETLVVTLSSGSDYSINEEKPPSAILSIQDNDTPGIRVVEIGDTTVTENGTSEFYISLLSQPEADVTIALNGVSTERKLIVDQAYSNTASTIQLKVDDSQVNSLLLPAGTYTLGNANVTVSSNTTIFSDKFTEVAVSSISSNITASDSLTYSYTELGFDNTYTFNSDNWYKLQTVTVKGIDDSVAETGDFHSSTVEYTVSSTDSNYDGFEVPPQTINIIDRTFDSENTTESLIEGFFALQDGLDSVTLPIIGNLDNVAPSFIEDFIGDLVEEVKQTEYLTAESLQDAFNNVLSDRFGMVNVEITDLSTDNIEFKVNIEDSFNKSITLNGDLGLPALGIKIESDGSIEANFDYGIDLAFGISTDDGFYINTEDTGFDVSASLSLSDEFTATGKLAFLQIEAINGDNIGGTNIDAEFTISLEDADTSDDSNDEDEKKLTLTELNNLRKSDNLFDSIKYGFSGDAALDLDVVTSIKGNTGFPSLGLNISSNLPLFNYSNTDDEDEDENVKLTVVSSSANSLNIESSDSTNIVRLNKDTELTFGNTSVIVKEDTDIKPGEETTVNVSLADGTQGTINSIAAGTIIETSKIPLLTISSSRTSQEGKKTTLEVTSNNEENIIRLKKDTELNFGGTRVILKKVIYSEGDVDINSELIDIQPGDTPTTIEVTVVGDGDNNSGEFLTIGSDTTADISVGETLNSDPSLTLSEKVTSKEGDSTTLKVTSNNVTDTLQLNKGTQLKFGETGHKVTLEETAYIESGDTPTEIKVTVADDGDDNKEESVTIAKDATAELVSSEFNISFNDITLDTGGFITDLMSPVINYVNDLIQPFEPIIDVLQTEIKLLETLNLVDLFDEDNDGSATLIEVASYLASTFGGTELKYQKFFSAVTGIIDLVDTLEDLQSDIDSGENLSINFGNYSLENFKGASDDEEDSASNTDTEESGGDELNSDTKEQAKNSGSGSTGNKITNFFNQLDELGISIPLIEDPFIAINLLLGQDIDLVTYDIPELDINFKITQEFPIFGSISGLLEGAFSLSSDLLVGFDTYGFSRWEDKGFDLKDSHLILDGFYLSDVDPDTGKDVDELTMDATIAAGVSASAVVAKAEVTGGITGKAGLDIIDGGEFTGESDGKLRGSEVLAADSLFDLFTLSGSLEAFIKAVVKVGIDVGLFEVMKTVWKEKFSITLFEFELGGSSGTVSQSYIEGATVFFDSNLNGILEEGEPVTTSNADGSYNLEIPLLFFDTNDNGKIDPEEGRIVTEGGTDTSSGVAIETPLIAPYGAKMVTPLTTLKQKLIEDGSTPEEAEQSIKEALEIPEDINLEEFDALDAMSKGDERGSKVYKAHVQMQSLFAQTSEFMKGFDKEELEDKKRPIPEQAIDAIAKGIKKRKGKGKGKSPIDFNNSVELEELIKEPLEGKIKPKSADKQEKLPKSFSVLAQTMASGNKEIDEVFKGVPAKDILGKVAPVKKVTQDKLPKELRKLIGGAKREDITGLLERSPDAEQFVLKEESQPGDKPPKKNKDENQIPIIDAENETTLPITPRKAKKLAKGQRARNLLELDGDDLTDTKIKFSLSSKNLPEGRIHEIAIFTTEDEEATINGLSPEDAGYKEAALKKARSIFSILPDDFIANPKRIMKGFADKNIGFLLIKNGTVDSARRGRTSLDSVLLGTEKQGDSFRGMQIGETGENSFRLSFEDEMGDADFTDIVIDAELTDETPEIGTDIQGQSEGEMLDLRNYEGKQIQIQAPIVREESAYENVVGFYVVEDENGAVRDPLTGDLVNPGEEGYIKAALRNSQNNAFQMGEQGIAGSKEIKGGQIFAPFAIANGTLEEVLDDNPDNDPQVYFAYIDANTDGVDHIRNLGGNTWGVEDMLGGGDKDYNDIVFKLDVSVKI